MQAATVSWTCLSLSIGEEEYFFSDCFYNIYLEKVPCDKTENEKKKQQQPQEADSNSLHPPLSTELTAAVIKKSFGGEMCLWSIIFNYPIQKYQVWNSRKASVKARPVTLKLAVVLEGKLRCRPQEQTYLSSLQKICTSLFIVFLSHSINSERSSQSSCYRLHCSIPIGIDVGTDSLFLLISYQSLHQKPPLHCDCHFSTDLPGQSHWKWSQRQFYKQIC